MGALVSVRKASALAVAIAAAATSITVTEAGASGLNYTQGDDVRLMGLASANAVVQTIVNMNDNDNNAAVVGETVSGLSAASSGLLAGAVVMNVESDNDLVENTDFVIDYERGGIRFIDTADVVPGDTYGVQAQYRRYSSRKVNLGKSLPTLECSVRLVHTYPDGRKMTITLWRVSVSPENPSLAFDDGDWIGTELNLEVLDDGVNHPEAPFGEIDIQNAADGTPLEGYDPDTYSVGSFDLFLTPVSATAAAARGISTTEIDVGNVKVGSVEGNNTYLKHFRGIPKKKDKVVLTQKELNVKATIENLNTVNLAFLFDGQVVEDDNTAQWQDFAILVTVPADFDGKWIPLRKLQINPADS